MPSLSDAYLDFMDILRVGGKAKWHRLRQQQAGDDDKASSIAQRRRWAFEHELQIELIDGLREGKFRAVGRDITHDANPPQRSLSAALFNPSSPDFALDWESNSLIAFGKRIIDISVSVNEPLNDEGPPAPKKGGRPNHIGKAIDEACRIAADKDSNFCGMPAKKALIIVDQILAYLPDRPPALDNGANLKTFRGIRKSFCEATTQKSQN